MHGRRLAYLLIFTSSQNDEPSQAEVDAYVEYHFPDEDFALQLDINTTSKFVYIVCRVSLSATKYIFIYNLFHS